MNVISTGVDCNRFSLKHHQTNQLKEITLLYVGRLISRKNVDKIIYAFEKLCNKYKLKLIIVGDGPDKERLEKISDHVEFTGVIPDTENMYKQADIFISPSEYGEGLQGSILEAMSCGLTVVATNTQINAELLAEGRGFTVDTSVESIADGIKKAIISDRQEIAKKSRKYMLEHYDWRKKAKEILEVLK